MHETSIKTRLIDFLIGCPIAEDQIITSELRFADGKRRADLALLTDSIYAFEIKGDRDNLDKLSSQIVDYKNCFNYTVVVTTEKHIDKVKPLYRQGIGVLLFREGKFEWIYAPKKRTKLSKYCMASYIRHQDLNNILKSHLTNIHATKKTSTELRKLAALKLSTEVLHNSMIQTLREKHIVGYLHFLSERGELTVIDDLSLFRVTNHTIS